MTRDTLATIASSARRFSLGTFFSRLSGFVREVGMAAVFGTSPEVAAFWMAFRFAHLLRRLFGEGGLHVAFVPHFEELRRQDPEKGAAFFYGVFHGLTLVLLALILCVEGALGATLYFIPLTPGTANVMRLTMILLPALIFICLFALNSAFLHCQRVYFLPSVAPAALNVLWLVALALVWQAPQAEAIERLAMLIVFAFAAQWLMTLPHAYPFLNRGFKSKAPIHAGRLLKPIALALVGIGAVQVNTALDTLFARAADPSGPAYLWYALRLQQVPLALIGVGLTGALLPPISRAIGENDLNQARTFLRYAVQKTVLLMVPLTAALMGMGKEGVILFYERGAFTHESALETTRCLYAYGLGLVPMTLVLLFATPFYALKNYRVPAFVSVASVACNVGLNTLLVFGLHVGAMGVALATSSAACLNCALLMYFLHKKIGKVGEIAWVKCTLFAALAYGACLWVPEATTTLGIVAVLALKGSLFLAAFLLSRPKAQYQS